MIFKREASVNDRFPRMGGEMNGSTSTSVRTSSWREQSQFKVTKHTEGRICTSQLAAFALCGFRTNFHKLIIDYPQRADHQVRFIYYQ